MNYGRYYPVSDSFKSWDNSWYEAKIVNFALSHYLCNR